MNEPDKTILWQDTPVLVFGQTRFLGEIVGGHLYHGTVADLPDGAVLEPGYERNFTESSPDRISITSDPSRAHLWADKNSNGKPVFVYEIEPLSEVSAWRTGLANYGKSIVLWEGRVASARIIKRFTFDEVNGIV